MDDSHPFLLLQHQAKITTEGNPNASSLEVTTLSIAEHGVYCLLIFEYCYFLLQNGQAPMNKDVIPVAIHEYKSSCIEVTIHQAVKSAVQQHGHHLEHLCPTLLEIVLENRLSHKLVL
ncbi:hypothetical protein BKA82DRAFT_21403 [Pisolithus tinctorius]|uniref:Uncharacterized protein n=1 Tax=Pisolithus tinctorius Marx 270 TaxID=870435 RepID=A0A0C3PA66_PISTI|nr:hypothetical protein BKA82DRAFT_21403 [Pisolithus tinctorius]KIO10485.1 hypothetical protein M404DRAFT_21403 [Pisolithus tinctorius Marx 270]